MIEPLEVVAAVIDDGNGRYLLAKRPPGKYLGGYWEFAGGKVEANESYFEAIVRECREELGIEILAAQPFCQVIHSYPEKKVKLNVLKVLSYRGEPVGKEGQELVWAGLSDFSNYAMPAANIGIVSRLNLPENYIITPKLELKEDLIKQLYYYENNYKNIAVRIRQPDCSIDVYKQFLDAIREEGFDKRFLCVQDRLELFELYPTFGFHFTEKQLEQSYLGVSPLPLYREGCFVFASIHSAAMCKKAIDMGVSAVTYSPVLTTDSHVGAKPLGWSVFEELASSEFIPVYALGGLECSDMQKVKQHSGYGLAGITCFSYN